ncbi:MAG: ATP-binding cassette domain-containing protein, partial [Silvanigrellaceae bacterium]|nr:ATP-binding cassette domain-containing protein [Silvanigrellaceae bacterium]
VIVSHDRALLDTLVNKILEIEQGEARSFEGNYELYMQQKLDFLQADEKRHEKAANLLKRELSWLRTGAKARTTKQTARIKRAKELDRSFQKNTERKQQVQKVSAIEFNAEINSDKKTFSGEGSFVSELLLGHLGHQELIQAKNLSFKIPHKHYEEFWIFKELNFLMKPKTRIALLGPNGCGKSTLMKLMMGSLQPSQGSFVFHENIKISYFDQHRHSLQGELTLRQTISPEGDFVFFDGKSLHIISFLERFLFGRLDLNRPVKDLSGGEQSRLLLAKIMLERANVLLLDEPTNDLDIQTLQTLERNLAHFEGAILFTSHDRYFLQKCATKFLTYGGISQCSPYKAWANWLLCEDLDQALSYLESTKKEQDIIDYKEKKQEKKENDSATKYKKARLSLGEQKEYESLEGEISQLESKLKLNSEILDKAYAESQSYVTIENILAQILAAEEELRKKNARWEELFLKL